MEEPKLTKTQKFKIIASLTTTIIQNIIAFYLLWLCFKHIFIDQQDFTFIAKLLIIVHVCTYIIMLVSYDLCKETNSPLKYIYSALILIPEGVIILSAIFLLTHLFDVFFLNFSRPLNIFFTASISILTFILYLFYINNKAKCEQEEKNENI
jgi:L-asparagine transporter-like permease